MGSNNNTCSSSRNSFWREFWSYHCFCFLWASQGFNDDIFWSFSRNDITLRTSIACFPWLTPHPVALRQNNHRLTRMGRILLMPVATPGMQTKDRVGTCRNPFFHLLLTSGASVSEFHWNALPDHQFQDDTECLLQKLRSEISTLVSQNLFGHSHSWKQLHTLFCYMFCVNRLQWYSLRVSCSIVTYHQDISISWSTPWCPLCPWLFFSNNWEGDQRYSLVLSSRGVLIHSAAPTIISYILEQCLPVEPLQYSFGSLVLPQVPHKWSIMGHL